MTKKLKKPEISKVDKWHGWTTPEQAIDMVDEIIRWLKAGGHPCPFKREGE
jgi:hypothetical protein